MARYVCHGVTLKVEQDGSDEALIVARVLQGLWWARTADGGSVPRLRLRISRHDGGWRVPLSAQPVWEVDGFQGHTLAEDLYITDGQSLLHVQPQQGTGAARLAPDFCAKPSYAQQTFWMLGLLKLLRQQPEGVVALAWCRTVSVNADAAGTYADLPLGAAAAGPTGRRKRRVRIEDAYPGQQVASGLPRLLLFAQVVPQATSTVLSLAQASALQQLLAQSGPLLFDRASMTQHVAVLTRLLQQAPPYGLRAGLDVYQAPGQVERLLTAVMGAT